MSPVSWLRSTPLLARVAPFIIFVVITSLQGSLGEGSRYSLYVLKTFVGAWMVWVVRPVIPEIRWTFSFEAIVVGFAVFAAWVGLDAFYPKFGDPGKAWTPLKHYEAAPALGWLVVICRTVGSSVVVPPIEEAFYRSFVYRWIVSPEFTQIELRQRSVKALAITSLMFGFAHREWLPGILCGLAYQALTLRAGHLGPAISAHAVTNLLLGGWVVFKGAWQFW